MNKAPQRPHIVKTFVNKHFKDILLEISKTVGLITF